MRLLIQRVQEAKVMIDQQLYNSIEKGLLVFIAIHLFDGAEEIEWMVNKLIHLRIFSDDKGKMNQSLQEQKAQLLVISQFTLYGNCKNGRRPDYFQAAPPKIALPLYEKFLHLLTEKVAPLSLPVKSGKFGAAMQVHLINDGPVTLLIETPLKN